MGMNFRRLLVALAFLSVLFAGLPGSSAAGSKRSGATVFTRSTNPMPTSAGEPDGGSPGKDKSAVGPSPTTPPPDPDLVRWTRLARTTWTTLFRSGWLYRW